MGWMVVLVGIAGCAGDDPKDTGSTFDSGCEPDWQPVSHVDAGTVCFGTVAAGQDIELQVSVDDCLSSSCDQNLGGSCVLADNGDGTLTLTSEVVWETNANACVCTDDCGLPAVQCTLSGGLPDGTYTVTHGTETLTLTVPSSDPCYPY